MDESVHRKIESFFENHPLYTYDKGQLIVHAGDDPKGVMYLKEGQVRQFDITSGGDEVVVNVFKPPAFFPIGWALNDTENQYFFDAFTTSKIRIAPKSDVVAFLEKNHDVAMDLMRRLYIGVDGMQRRMAHLMGGSARNRVLFELIVECRRFGKKQNDGSSTIDLHVSEIANRAGLTRETVSREIKKLSNEHLLKVEHSGITVTDLKKIVELLDDEL